MAISVQPENADRQAARRDEPDRPAYRQPTPFDSVRPEEAAKAISDRTPAVVTANKKFVEGDHWQGGAGWIGPMPANTHPTYSTLVRLVQRLFVSKNVIAEIVERHMSGVVGREPTWTILPRRVMDPGEEPTAEEQKLIDEANRELLHWWKERELHTLVQQAVARLLWASRAPARMYVPLGFLRDVKGSTGVVSAKTLRGALSKIFVDALDIEAGTVYTDPDSKQKLGIFRPKPKENGEPQRTFLVHLEGIDPEADAGDEGTAARKTVFRILTDGGSLAQASGRRPADTPLVLDLGERITMHEMNRPLLITEQVQQANKAINFAATTLPRALETAGFTERTLLNVQINGRMVDDPNDPGEKKFVPDDLPQFGAGMTTVLEGKTIEDKMGGQTLATPGVVYKTPSPVTPIIEGKRSHYEDALEEADQSHVLIQGEATPSGKSREEARADYEMSLSQTETQVLAFIRWMLETALAMAEAFIGGSASGKWTRTLRIEPRLRIRTAKLSTSERERNAADVEKRLLSRETAMELADVPDTEAENIRIEGDPLSQYGSAKALGEALGALVTAGATFEGACTYLGLDPEEVADLLKRTELSDAATEGDPDNPSPDPEGDPDPAPVAE